MMKTEELKLTQEWDKTFPKSDKVDHCKVTFVNHFGITLAAEKEMIFVVVKSAQKNDIMSALMKPAGMESKAKSICFTLPVSATAGLRLVEDD